ncbi:MAG: DUF2484 family protein [Maritimibacter sp.]
MSAPLVIMCVWLVAANFAAMLPTQRKHWPAAIVLMVLLVPLLVWVVREDGWIIGVFAALAAASILRWPLRFFMRWLRAGLARLGGKG